MSDMYREALRQIMLEADFDSQSYDGSWACKALDRIWAIAARAVASGEADAESS